MIDPSEHEITIMRTRNGWIVLPQSREDRMRGPRAVVAESAHKLANLIAEWGAKQEAPPVEVPKA
jgi:hypothetical protein